MPYRGQQSPFFFEGLHLACISGDNGAGKSSLIDAITWAIWGKCRASSDDDVITQGENETDVCLDFRAGEQVYRVERRRTRSKKAGGSGTPDLHFCVLDNGQSLCLDGNTIRATEDKLNDAVKMDYDTFINSAYLKQGESDLFSKARPNERRGILTRIMNLGYYEDLQAKAKDKANEFEAQRRTLEVMLLQANQRLAAKSEIENSLEIIEKEVDEGTKLKKARQAAVDSLKKSYQLLANRQERLDAVFREIGLLSKEKRQVIEEQKTTEARIRAHRTVACKKTQIEQGYSQYLQVKSECDELNRKLAELNRLWEERQKPDEAIIKETRRISDQLNLWRGKLEEFEIKAASIDLIKDDLAVASNRSRQFESELKRLDSDKESLKSRQKRLAEAAALRAQLEREILDIDEKIKLLGDKHGGNCPVCHAELDDARFEDVLSVYQVEKKAKLGRILEIDAEINLGSEALRLSEEALKSRTTELEAGARQAQSKEKVLEAQLKDAEESAKRVFEGRKKIAEQEEILSSP